MNPPHPNPEPLLYVPFLDFRQNRQFSKNVSNDLDSKKGRLHFRRTAEFTCWLVRIPGENRAKLKKLFNLINRLRWGTQMHRMHLLFFDQE